MYVPLVNDEVKFSQVVKIKWTFFIFTYGIKMYNLEKKKICSGLEMTSLFFFFFNNFKNRINEYHERYDFLIPIPTQPFFLLL